jgi:hypothetical protein
MLILSPRFILPFSRHSQHRQPPHPDFLSPPHCVRVCLSDLKLDDAEAAKSDVICKPPAALTSDATPVVGPGQDAPTSAQELVTLQRAELNHVQVVVGDAPPSQDKSSNKPNRELIRLDTAHKGATKRASTSRIVTGEVGGAIVERTWVNAFVEV